MVKKLACLLITFVCLQLAGCKSTAPAPEAVAEKLNSGYNTQAVVQYQDIKAEVNMLKDEGRCQVAFQSPDTLKDLSFDYNGELVTINYGKLSFSVEPNSLPGQALSSLLISTLNASLNDQGVTIEDKDNALKIMGDTNGSKFELVLDRANGNALTLEVPDDQLKLEFYNFSFLS